MSIEFHHGTESRFYYGGLDMSPYAESVAMTLSRALAEYRPLSPNSIYRVSGRKDIQIALTGGAMDTDPDTNDAKAWAAYDDPTPAAWTYLPMGDVLGRVAYLGMSIGENQSRVAGDDIVRLPIALTNAALVDHGVVLRALAAGGVSPSAAVNNGAESLNGGAGYLIVTALTGTLTVVIEHSVDGATLWEALVTFTARLTGETGSQVVEVPAGTTVRQYLRISWTLPTGAATWFAAFGRR